MTIEQQGQPATAASKSKDVRVRITVPKDGSAPYGIRWMGWLWWSKPPIPTDQGYNNILCFEIDDKSRSGVTFAASAESAFGADADTASCPAPGSNADGEIDFAASQVDGNKMTIRNINRNAGDLNFAVYFSNGEKLDPIIRNTGGGT
jgi:hypothetical protein